MLFRASAHGYLYHQGQIRTRSFHGDNQRIIFPAPGRLFIHAQHFNIINHTLERRWTMAIPPCQTANAQRAILRAGHGDGINRFATASEAEIFARIGFRNAIGKLTFFYTRRPFLSNTPNVAVINGFAIDP